MSKIETSSMAEMTAQADRDAPMSYRLATAEFGDAVAETFEKGRVLRMTLDFFEFAGRG